jgi:hypothetical protein
MTAIARGACCVVRRLGCDRARGPALAGSRYNPRLGAPTWRAFCAAYRSSGPCNGEGELGSRRWHANQLSTISIVAACSLAFVCGTHNAPPVSVHDSVLDYHAGADRVHTHRAYSNTKSGEGHRRRVVRAASVSALPDRLGFGAPLTHRSGNADRCDSLHAFLLHGIAVEGCRIDGRKRWRPVRTPRWLRWLRTRSRCRDCRRGRANPPALHRKAARRRARCRGRSAHC